MLTFVSLLFNYSVSAPYYIYLLLTVNFGLCFNIDHVIIPPPSTGSSTAGRTDYTHWCVQQLSLTQVVHPLVYLHHTFSGPLMAVPHFPLEWLLCQMLWAPATPLAVPTTVFCIYTCQLGREDWSTVAITVTVNGILWLCSYSYVDLKCIVNCNSLP